MWHKELFVSTINLKKFLGVFFGGFWLQDKRNTFLVTRQIVSYYVFFCLTL